MDAVVARLAREDAEEAAAARRRRAAEHREMDAQRAAHAEAQRLQAAWERAEEDRCRFWTLKSQPHTLNPCACVMFPDCVRKAPAGLPGSAPTRRGAALLPLILNSQP